MKKRTLLGLLALVPSLWLAGCGGGSNDSGDAKMRLVNASAGYASLDLVPNDSTNSDSVGSKISAVAYGTASGYVSLPSDTIYTNLAVAGSGTYVAEPEPQPRRQHQLHRGGLWQPGCAEIAQLQR